MRPTLKILSPLILLLFLILPAISYAGNLDDNALEHYISGEKMNLRLEVSGMYHKGTDTTDYNRRRLRDDNLPRDFTIEFNGNTIVEKGHTQSVGTDPIGDGNVDIERQTMLFDVTGLVKPGENKLTITDVDSPTKPYFYDGAVLLNFYPSREEHQYWIYHGSEYLEKIDYNDAFYEDYFMNVESPEKGEATLYTVFQNKEQEHDALYFNENLLADNDANYFLSGSHIVVKSQRYQRDEGSPFIQYDENPSCWSPTI